MKKSQILSFAVIYHFLKQRRAKTVKIIDYIVFYISCYPMASAGKPGKSWNFIMGFSRTGKSWKRPRVLESTGNLINLSKKI